MRQLTAGRVGFRVETGNALRAAAAAGVPIRAVALERPEVTDAYQRGLVLVRPDGHVAWRDDAEPQEPAAVIEVLRGPSRSPGLDGFLYSISTRV